MVLPPAFDMARIGNAFVAIGMVGPISSRVPACVFQQIDSERGCQIARVNPSWRGF